MSEITFRRDTAFRKTLFTPDHFAHPAKMDAQLLLWIVDQYTAEGETILDPMGGSGTAMLACTLGRNVVMVELEAKFIEMQKANWEKVRMMPQLGCQMGDCRIVQGDARNLGDVLADSIITSPPYALTVQSGHEGVQAWKVIEGMKGADNETLRARSRELAEQQRILNQYGKASGQIGNLTSPPYEEAMGQKHHSPRADKLAMEKSNPVTYTERVDSIVTSPPYENQIHPTHETVDWVKATNDPQHLGPHSQAMKVHGYGGDATNIGNLKAESYLSAMLQVYQQCHAVLRAGGLMILVTKNFIRNKQEVRLDEDTIKLCEEAGFRFRERHYRKLPAQSFWRVIYQQKYPDAPVLDKEDVLVFEKAVTP